MSTVVHLAALSAVGAGYPAGIPVLGGGALPAPPAPPVPPALVVPPLFVVPPLLVVPPLRAVPVVPPAPPFPPAPPVATLPPTAEVPPVPDVPPVPRLQVSRHRPQMSDGTTRSVAQHAQAQTVSVHWPSTGIGTSSSEEQVHRSLPSLASHWAMAVYCTLHFVVALTVASASATQAVWQSATGVHIPDVDAHIAAQACCRVCPVPELLEVFPPVPTPPAPPRVPPVADPVTPPEAIPPLADDLPPLAGTPPRAPPLAGPVTPPEAIPPVPSGVLPPPDVPARDVVPPPERPPTSELLLLLEQENANSIAAGRMRTIEPVFRIWIPPST